MATDRAPLTRERIAQEALALVDADGLEGLTMRRLAGRLGVEAMSLYHHVDGKPDLLVAVADAVLSEIGGSDAEDWQARITDVFGQFRSACLAHPGAVPLVVATGFTTPSALAPIDTILGALEQAGMDETGRVLRFRLLLSFALGAISCELADAAAAPTDTDPHEGVDLSRLPHLVAVAERLIECDPAADFDEGLRQLLNAPIELPAAR